MRLLGAGADLVVMVVAFLLGTMGQSPGFASVVVFLAAGKRDGQRDIQLQRKGSFVSLVLKGLVFSYVTLRYMSADLARKSLSDQEKRLDPDGCGWLVVAEGSRIGV